MELGVWGIIKEAPSLLALIPLILFIVLSFIEKINQNITLLISIVIGCILTGNGIPQFGKAMSSALSSSVGVIGFIIASLVNRPLKGRSVFRGILILPWIFPDVVVALLWKWIFNTQNGILNAFLQHLGLVNAPVTWLSSASTAMLCVIFVSIWKGFPLVMVQLLAGLQTIPEDLYEAAKIDGANAFQRFRYVTIPSLKPIISTVLILDTVWVFKQFTLVYIQTSGGPGSATMVSAIEIYKRAFSYFEFGYASAESVFILVICYAIGKIFRRLMDSE